MLKCFQYLYFKDGKFCNFSFERKDFSNGNWRTLTRKELQRNFFLPLWPYNHENKSQNVTNVGNENKNDINSMFCTRVIAKYITEESIIFLQVKNQTLFQNR